MPENNIAKVVCVAKAESIGNRHAPKITIDISGQLPNSNEFKSLNEWRDWLKREGQMIERALFESLPGGTYDALLLAMVERNACLLRVPFAVPEASKEDTNA